jgi:predicted MPP superfamily phosphohydrolase
VPAGSGNYIKGKFTKENNTLYVSKGIGSGGILDIRFFANRDIILLKGGN